MKISYNWLKQHITPMPAVGELDNLLTQLGLEVEDIATTGLTADKLQGLVVGEVIACDPHPNADKLKLTKVNIGTGEPLNIVCGAPNVEQGQKVIVAPVGTQLFPLSGESFKIKKSKIRGEESNGMLCAEDEIGLGSSHAGLLILPADSTVGAPVATYLNLDNDALIEIGITPNHADACSHLGVARELQAAMRNQGKAASLTYDFSIMPALSFQNSKNPVQVKVADAALCPRYAGLYVSGIKVEPSPEWLQQKIKSIGQKPINNIVDITNYVLHDIGQPIHAFDANKINGNEINVRLAKSDEKFITLDGVERKLEGTELMICDAFKPMAIGGVFGGSESGVSADTQNIFIESAYFHPGTVRKSARTHGLNTDASFRFERGTDPDIVVWALYYTAKLITEISGGTASAEVIDQYPTKILPSNIQLSFDFLRQVIGQEIPAQEVKNILESLNCKVTQETATALTVSVPAYKNDVTTAIDLAEEVLRVYGLNRINLPGKITTSLVLEGKNKLPAFREALAQSLACKGFNEIMTNSLTKVAYQAVEDGKRVALLNPLSSDLGVMRDTMLFTGLEAVAYNLNRNNFQLQLFETGKTYHLEQKAEQASGSNASGASVKYKEEEHCALFITGKEEKLHALKPVIAPDFYTIKTAVIALLKEFGITGFKSQPSENKLLKYGIALTLNNKLFAEIGSVDNALLKQQNITQEVFYADILLKTAYKNSAKGFIQVKAVSKFPAVRRDLSLLIDNKIQFAQLETVALKAEFKLLKEVGVFDIYQGEKLGPDKKSYALYFILQDEERTLDDKSINNAMQRIQQALEKETGAVIR